MRDSDRTWRRWGEIDPYFAVLTDARYRSDAIAQHRDEFFAQGEAYVAERIAAAERVFGGFGRERALDFGCGVGRLALPLARRFGAVIGLDIAPAMLEEARRNAAGQGVANIDFRLSDDALSEAAGPFDLVLSCIVLQHIPVSRGMTIIRGLLERVGLGGVAALHLSLDRQDGHGQRLHYWARRHLPGIDWLTRVVNGRTLSEPVMQMNEYRLDKVLSLAEALGFGEAIVRIERHGRFITASLLMRREYLG